MDIVFILLRVVTFSWALVLIWRLRAWRGWLYGLMSLFAAVAVTISLQAPASIEWLFSLPPKLTPTVLLIWITRLSFIILAERSVAARVRAEQQLRRTNDLLEERVEERTKELRQTAVALEKESGAVRQSEEQLRLVTNALPVCIAYADSQQRYLFNNKTYEDWFGLKSDEIKRLTIKEVLGERAYQKAYRVKQLLEAVREVLEPAQTGQARGAVG
jgi:PAS domain-containing protein